MQQIAGLLLTAALFFLLALPGLLVASAGWRLSRRIKNHLVQTVIRAGLVSVSITPASYGHAGIVPAIWATFFPPVRGTTDWAAIVGLMLIWFIALLLFLWWPKLGTRIQAGG